MIDEPSPRQAGTQAVHGPGGPPLTRRQFIYGARGLAALALVGWRGFEQPHSTPAGAKVLGTSAPVALTAATTTSADVYNFVTRPDFSPPVVYGHELPGTGEPGHLAPLHHARHQAVQRARPRPARVMIIDRAGRLVWFEHIAPVAHFDFNAQSYQGQPAPTWWEGAVGPGYGAGVGQMADSSNRFTQTIRASDGLMADLHELNLTSKGTALVTAYQVTTTDLSSIGGSRKGKVLAGHARRSTWRRARSCSIGTASTTSGWTKLMLRAPPPPPRSITSTSTPSPRPRTATCSFPPVTPGRCTRSTAPTATCCGE
jgi:hypothetical protein